MYQVTSWSIIFLLIFNTFIPGRSRDAGLFFLLTSTSKLQIYLLAYLHWQWGSWICVSYGYRVRHHSFSVLSTSLGQIDLWFLSQTHTPSEPFLWRSPEYLLLYPTKNIDNHINHLTQHKTTFHSVHTGHLCIPYDSHNKERLVL